MGPLARLQAVPGWVDTRLEPLRGTLPWRAWARYSAVRGNVLAGGVAYFAFFSLFPAMALGFTVFALLLGSREDLQVLVVQYINSVFGTTVVGYQKGQGLVSIDQLVQPQLLTTTGVVGAVTLLFTGLGWVSALRDGVQAVFIVRDQQNVVVLKLADLLFLGAAGILVLVSVIAGVGVTTGTGYVLDLLGIARGAGAEATVYVLTQVMLTVVDAAIYTLLFHRLAGVPTRIGDLAPAAVIAAVAFTLLKIFASELFQGVTRNRFLATYGLIVGLLVWMNLVARVTLVAAALAATIATDRGHLTVPDPAALAGAERSGPVASGARSDGRAAGDADAVPHEHGRIQPAPDPQARRAARVLLLAGFVAGAATGRVLDVVSRGRRRSRRRRGP